MANRTASNSATGAGAAGVSVRPRQRRLMSPCIQVCVLNVARFCTGCRRSIDEIVGWSAMPPEEKRRVLDELPRRSI